MSGGGGGGNSRDSWRPASSVGVGVGGGGGGGRSEDPCAFTEITILSSPNAAVVGVLTIGTVLNVVLQTQPALRVVVVTTAGDVAGSITSARLVDMIECMRNGYAYSATVQAVSGGQVTVEIHPA